MRIIRTILRKRKSSPIKGKYNGRIASRSMTANGVSTNRKRPLKLFLYPGVSTQDHSRVVYSTEKIITDNPKTVNLKISINQC